MKSGIKTNSTGEIHVALVIIICLFLGSCMNQEGNRKTRELISKVENSLVRQVVIEGDSVQHFNIEERMSHYKVPGLSIAIIDGGKIQWAKGYGYICSDTTRIVDKNTMFQAASISKPVAALMALELVEEGKLSLDEDVNNYLKDWKIETNKFTKEKPVTLRGLLTHTAGLTVHGFSGYAEGKEIPDIIEVLNGEKPANSEPIRPDTVPGAISRYSGGGYIVMQKLLEDVTGESFPDLMKKNILDKTGMENSTYQQPLPESLFAQASMGNHSDGSRIEGNWHTYPEMAAAGLWTTPEDLAKYMIEVQQSYQGRSNKILSRNMTIQMLTKQAENQGLGPGLGGEGDSLTFSHGGANEGFRCMLFGFASTGKGFVIMTNSDNGSAVTWEIIRSISEVYNWNVFKPIVRKVTDLVLDSLLRFEGTYQMNPEYILHIVVKDNKLHVQQEWDKGEYYLYPGSDLVFFTIEDNTDFVFEETADNKINKFTVMGTYVFEKINVFN
jgi:CubicO group peptidase (beta-lactamase class C family)